MSARDDDSNIDCKKEISFDQWDDENANEEGNEFDSLSTK